MGISAATRTHDRDEPWNSIAHKEGCWIHGIGEAVSRSPVAIRSLESSRFMSSVPGRHPTRATTIYTPPCAATYITANSLPDFVTRLHFSRFPASDEVSSTRRVTPVTFDTLWPSARDLESPSCLICSRTPLQLVVVAAADSQSVIVSTLALSHTSVSPLRRLH